MAAEGDDDLKDLVFNEEIPESTYFPSEQVTEYGSTNEASPGQFSIEPSSSGTEQEQDFIVAVFVVSFDTRKGWEYSYLNFVKVFNFIAKN